MGAVSEHFRDQELWCPHCRINNCTPELVASLENLRLQLSKPIIVMSAYRCPEHNRKVGGVPSSQHLLGNAADIRVVGMIPATLERFVRMVQEFRGVGRDDHRGYVHADVRRHAASWCYDTSGKSIAYYAPPGPQTFNV